MAERQGEDIGFVEAEVKESIEVPPIEEIVGAPMGDASSDAPLESLSVDALPGAEAFLGPPRIPPLTFASLLARLGVGLLCALRSERGCLGFSASCRARARRSPRPQQLVVRTLQQVLRRWGPQPRGALQGEDTSGIWASWKLRPVTAHRCD